MCDSVPGKLETLSLISDITELHCESCKLHCEPCKQDGLSVPVAGYCVECQNYLCESCYSCHCKPLPMRGHKLLDKNEMPKRKVSAGVFKFCQKHNWEEIKYFCNSHMAVGCNSCIVTQHKPCKEILTIADIAEGIETSPELANLYRELDSMEDDLKHQLEKVQANKVESQNCKEAACTDIDDFQKKVKEHFENLSELFLQEASKIHQDNIADMEKTEQEVTETKSEVLKLKEELEELRDFKQNKLLFIAMVKTIQQKNTLQQRLVKSRQENRVTKYNFKPNENMVRLLSASVNPDAFGKLCTSDIAYGQKPRFGNAFQMRPIQSE